jgi:hypothetical protein
MDTALWAVVAGLGGVAPDRFGLLGLLSVIRMQDADLTTLALVWPPVSLPSHRTTSPPRVFWCYQSSPSRLRGPRLSPSALT